ncbi:MAG TPA: biopolymer transporter ExbD [Gemmatimonadaceae bacterium]|jgi:biopolymer transport protein ExbD|nr:biopolymer transporter ExbD [Gemmatimonadaceae bacterium]
MAVQLSSEGGVRAEPNVTPMIDVMLVLLIIFMIVIPQLLAGFNAIPPEGRNLKPHPNEDEDVILGIDAEGKFYLDKKPFSDQELPSKIREIYDARTTDKIMFIKADRNLKYSRIMEAMDIAAHQGVRVAALVTDQTKGTQSLIESDNAGQDLGIGPGSKGGKP